MKAFITYFNDVIAELKKVIWPTREMLMASTMVVIMVSLAFGAYIMVVDKMLSFVVRFILEG